MPQHHRDRCARYLSLDMEDSQTHALTVFSTTEGMCCVQIDGDERRRLGVPPKNSCAMTFYLGRGEAVQALYVVTRDSRYKGDRHKTSIGPFLLICLNI